MSAVRIACRTLLKSPGFTVIALVTLALGIGVNTSMYTLMDVLLFRAAPFPEPERLVRLHGTSAQAPRGGFARDEASEIREQTVVDPADATTAGRPFESVTVFTYWSNTYAEPGQPAERLAAIDATADLFKTFGVQPVLGRAFTADEEVPGRNQVALLSYALWQSRFGGDPSVIGRSLRLNAEQVTIIGVMPASFTYPMMWGRVDLWRPITTPRHILEDRTNRFFSVVARLNPGVSSAQAQAQLDPMMSRWATDHPHTTAGRSFEVMALHKSTTGNEDAAFIGLLVGLAGFVLLIACANLANLQLARTTVSARDFAIRSALGARRSQLIGYQLTESFVLAIAGGIGGVIVATWLNGLLSRAIRIGDSGGLPLPMDARILAVTVIVTVLTAGLFGLLPAWLGSRPDVMAALKQQSRGSTTSRGTRWLRSSLIVGEVALALALLAGAGVMIRGFQTFMRQDNGWDTNLILAANIHLPEASTYATEDQRRVAIEKLTLRLAQVGGVEQTAIASTLPLFGDSSTRGIHVDGQTSEDPSQVPLSGVTMVTSNFFATLGIPVLAGSTFRADLQADHSPVVVVNESLARKFWPNDSALGQRIGMQEGDGIVWSEIVGVVRDIRHPLNPANPSTQLQVYKPLVHEPWGYLNLLVRAENPARFKNDLRRVVADIDGDVAVQQLLTIPDAVDRYQHNLFVINYTLLGFAILGLALAALGLYGVISNLVAQRTSEFGIRLALGAKPSDVLQLVMVTGVKLALIGLTIGLGLAYGVNRFLGSFMPRLAASDPVTLGLVALILFGVTLFACWWPARRATRVDPLIALRAE